MKFERQNLRTAASDEPTGFVFQRENEWYAVYASRTADIYVNPATVPGWIKKTGGEPDEWKKWNVTTKLCGLNSFHTNTKRKEGRKEGRKKQEVMCEMAYLKVQNEHECVLRLECQKYRKKLEAWASLEVQFVGHASCLRWDGVCDISRFQSARTLIKGVISALLWLLHLLLHSRTERTSVLMRQVRKTGSVASS